MIAFDINCQRECFWYMIVFCLFVFLAELSLLASEKMLLFFFFQSSCRDFSSRISTSICQGSPVINHSLSDSIASRSGVLRLNYSPIITIVTVIKVVTGIHASLSNIQDMLLLNVKEKKIVVWKIKRKIRGKRQMERLRDRGQKQWKTIKIRDHIICNASYASHKQSITTFTDQSIHLSVLLSVISSKTLTLPKIVLFSNVLKPRQLMFSLQNNFLIVTH